MSKPNATISRWLLLLMIAGAVAACGDTWSGMKQDTKDNVEATGEAMEDAGEEVKDSVQ
jgi:predicted small secreted protein